MPMSLAASEYRAPWWLPGGHLQTIVPAELFPKAKVIYRREIWNTPDDDIIAVDWSTPEPIDPKAPIMVHIHGLEGSSNSHYARALMARCGQGGVRGVVIHYRGCGGVTNKKLRAYNAADAAELDWEFARLRELYPEAPIYAMGVSLGANNLLFWAGTRGEDAAKLVSGIVAVCAFKPRYPQRIQPDLRPEFHLDDEEKSTRKSQTFPGRVRCRENQKDSLALAV